MGGGSDLCARKEHRGDAGTGPFTPTPPPLPRRRPLGDGGGGAWEGVVLGGAMGEGSPGGLGGALGGAIGGVHAPKAKRWSITGSPYPPSNQTITLNLTLTFAASWFGHASHVD